MKWPAFLAVSSRPWFLAFPALSLISSLPPSPIPPEMTQHPVHDWPFVLYAMGNFTEGRGAGGQRFRALEVMCLHLGQRVLCVWEKHLVVLSGMMTKLCPGLARILPSVWDHVPNRCQHLQPHLVPWAPWTSLNIDADAEDKAKINTVSRDAQ